MYPEKHHILTIAYIAFVSTLIFILRTCSQLVNYLEVTEICQILYCDYYCVGINDVVHYLNKKRLRDRYPENVVSPGI